MRIDYARILQTKNFFAEIQRGCLTKVRQPFLAEDEGFDNIFACKSRQKSKKPPVFELVAAICHRHIAFNRFESHPIIKTRHPDGYLVFMAEDEGFQLIHERLRQPVAGSARPRRI